MLGQAITFAIFVWFCMRYVWPPIIDALAKREARIAEGLATAEKAKTDLAAAAEQSASLVQEGRSKAQDFIAQAEKRRDDMVQEAKNQARLEAERIIAAAKAQIEQERNLAREELRKAVAALALQGAEQILMREVDAKAHGEILRKLSAQL
jgi:F-type H+-transporting ATPase subunit b